MEQYKYKMLQIPPNVVVQRGNYTGEEAAKYLQNITNEQAQLGWEFYRVDTFTVHVQPGCLGLLFGQRQTTFDNYVVTFRRLIENVTKSVETARIQAKVYTLIRVKPEMGAASAGQKAEGQAMTVHGRNNDSTWLSLGMTGKLWINAADVDVIEGDVNNLPIIQPPT